MPSAASLTSFNTLLIAFARFIEQPRQGLDQVRMIDGIASMFIDKWCDNIFKPRDSRPGTQTQGGIVMSDLKTPKDIDEEYVLNQYKSKIDYYWAASGSNKRSYKRYRSWTVFLSSLVTLVSSISAAEFVQRPEWLRVLFAVATPVIAATLAIISGLGQNFHWGSAWRDMVINATRLEKERDRFLATKKEKRDIEKELDTLNSIVLEETRNFFQRVLDSEIKSKDQSDAEG